MGIKRYLLGINKRLFLVCLISTVILIFSWLSFNFLSPDITITGSSHTFNNIKQIKLINSDRTIKGKLSKTEDNAYSVSFNKGFNDKSTYQLSILDKNGKTNLIPEPFSLENKTYLTVKTHTQSVLTSTPDGYITYTTKDFSGLKFMVDVVLAGTIINWLILIFDWVYLGYVYRKAKVKLSFEICNSGKIKKLHLYDSYLKTNRVFISDHLRMIPKTTSIEGEDITTLVLSTRLARHRHRLIITITNIKGKQSKFLIEIPKDTPIIELILNPVKDVVVVKNASTKLPQVIHPYRIKEPKSK